MFDFDKLNMATGSFPEIKIVVDVGKKQQEEGKPDEEILGESLNFVVSQATSYFFQVINIYNKQVAEGIDALAMNGKWVNLGGVAKHALKNMVSVLEKEHENKKSMQDIIQLYKLQHAVVKSPIPKINEMFDSKWLKENYPKLVMNKKLKSITGGKDGKK